MRLLDRVESAAVKFSFDSDGCGNAWRFAMLRFSQVERSVIFNQEVLDGGLEAFVILVHFYCLKDFPQFFATYALH